MSVEVVANKCAAVLVCTTTGFAFGPVFVVPDSLEEHFPSPREYADAFIDWLKPVDPRKLGDYELQELVQRFDAYRADLVRCDGCWEWIRPDSPQICDECADEMAKDLEFEEHRHA